MSNGENLFEDLKKIRDFTNVNEDRAYEVYSKCNNDVDKAINHIMNEGQGGSAQVAPVGNQTEQEIMEQVRIESLKTLNQRSAHNFLFPTLLFHFFL